MVNVRASRVWLGAGALVFGVGAAMLCGAGAAAADSADDAGVAGRPGHATATSPAAARPTTVHRGSDARPRPAAAAPSAKSSAVPAAAPRAAAVVVWSTPSGPRRSEPKPPVPGPLEPSAVPVDAAQYVGSYYEQGSVKQFFAIGLVNTKATYSLNQNDTIRVQNSGNYFLNRGPKISIVGSAVPVDDTNTSLNVSFGPTNSDQPPGNYTILAFAPDYSWAIVSDPSGQSGYILTRSKTISVQQYQELVTQARTLGVRGRITPTVQYPA